VDENRMDGWMDGWMDKRVNDKEGWVAGDPHNQNVQRCLCVKAKVRYQKKRKKGKRTRTRRLNCLFSIFPIPNFKRRQRRKKRNE